MAEAAHGIYSTAMGPGTSYDKAEAYAHDITLLVLSAINLKGSLTMLSNSVSLCRSAGKELAARKTRLRPSEVIAQARSSKHIVDFDDLISFAGDYLDADGVTFLRKTMSEHADCKNVSDLRDVARILELGKEKTGRYLTKEEIKAGLNTLWDDGGVEGAVAAVERVFKGIKSGKDLIKNIRKIEYGSTELSNFAIEYRRSKGITSARRNVCVVEYKDIKGAILKKAFVSNENYHSEEVMIDFLKENKIPGKNVYKIFSEREPCVETVTNMGHDCAQHIVSYASEVDLSYAVSYGLTKEDGANARNILRKILKKIM